MNKIISSLAPCSRCPLHVACSSILASRRSPARWLSSAVDYPKAAFMVIGDEVLKGTTVDTNTPWLAKKLYSRGIDLVRVEVVRDNTQEIIESLGRLRGMVGKSGFVFTSGGIGPTHDDVTYDAIAQGSGRSLEVHKETQERMIDFYGKKNPPQALNDGRLRMATLPSNCEVLYTQGIWVPLVNCDGTYILPGIPALFQRMIEGNEDRFTGPEKFGAQLYTQMLEGDFATPLGQIASENPEISIGSYPRTAPLASVSPPLPMYNVKVVIDGRDRAKVEAVIGLISAEIKVEGVARSWEA